MVYAAQKPKNPFHHIMRKGLPPFALIVQG